jgi:hypothetical protein
MEKAFEERNTTGAAKNVRKLTGTYLALYGYGKSLEFFACKWRRQWRLGAVIGASRRGAEVVRVRVYVVAVTMLASVVAVALGLSKQLRRPSAAAGAPFVG